MEGWRAQAVNAWSRLNNPFARNFPLSPLPAPDGWNKTNPQLPESSATVSGARQHRICATTTARASAFPAEVKEWRGKSYSSRIAVSHYGVWRPSSRIFFRHQNLKTRDLEQPTKYHNNTVLLDHPTNPLRRSLLPYWGSSILPFPVLA